MKLQSIPNRRFLLGFVLATFLLLQWFMPLRTAIKIGADEDFELAKATLSAHGYHLYSQIWNDQPPFSTFLLSELIRHISASVLWPRVLTVSFACILIGSLFALAHKTSGLMTATVASGLLIGSPGFLELSGSCMLEIQALAPAIASLAILWVGRASRYVLLSSLAGVCFGMALQLKLIVAMYLPLAVLIICHRTIHAKSELKSGILHVLLFGLSMMLTFVLLNYATGNSLLLQIEQARISHFAQTQPGEYGAAVDHPFNWMVFLRHWDTVLPVIMGLALMIWDTKRPPETLLPIVWLGWTVLVFSIHRPWWAYYYVHNAVPLAWCAGIGLVKCWQALTTRKRFLWRATFALFCLCGFLWMGTRVLLEEWSVRASPRIYSSLILKELSRYKPFARFMFTDQPVYSFHAQIPMPPDLAVIPLKRLWSGEMSGSRLTSELESIQPEIILLANQGQEVPYQKLVDQKYRLVYRDSANRLYVHRAIVSRVGF